MTAGVPLVSGEEEQLSGNRGRMTRKEEHSESVMDVSVDSELRRDDCRGSSERAPGVGSWTAGGTASAGPENLDHLFDGCLFFRSSCGAWSPALFRVHWPALRPAQKDTAQAALNTPFDASLGGQPQVKSLHVEWSTSEALPFASRVVAEHILPVGRKPVRSSFKLQPSIAKAHFPSGSANCLQAYDVPFHPSTSVSNLPHPPSFHLFAPASIPSPATSAPRRLHDTPRYGRNITVSIQSIPFYINPATLLHLFTSPYRSYRYSSGSSLYRDDAPELQNEEPSAQPQRTNRHPSAKPLARLTPAAVVACLFIVHLRCSGVARLLHDRRHSPTLRLPCNLLRFHGLIDTTACYN